MVMFYSLVGLVPWYPLCHLLLTFVDRSFPSAPLVPTSLRIPSVGFSATTPPVASLPPIPLDTTHGGWMRGAAYSAQPHPHHESCGRCFTNKDPAVPLPRLVLAINSCRVVFNIFFLAL